ncbi:MAG: hypothetical protein OXU73_01395 [Candidatus Campbellbacteria bacterium]|nr:hypothetical protein [Candidatus Campbellbacteria bacterium]
MTKNDIEESTPSKSPDCIEDALTEVRRKFKKRVKLLIGWHAKMMSFPTPFFALVACLTFIYLSDGNTIGLVMIATACFLFSFAVKSEVYLAAVKEIGDEVYAYNLADKTLGVIELPYLMLMGVCCTWSVLSGNPYVSSVAVFVILDGAWVLFLCTLCILSKGPLAKHNKAFREEYETVQNSWQKAYAREACARTTQGRDIITTQRGDIITM